MNVFRIRKLELGSFIRVSVAIAAALGLIFALVVLIGTLLGLGDAYFDFGFVKVTGIVPAILGIFVMPVVFGFGSLLTAQSYIFPSTGFYPSLEAFAANELACGIEGMKLGTTDTHSRQR